MTYTQLVTYIESKVYQNAIRAITGTILQDVLKTIAAYFETNVASSVTVLPSFGNPVTTYASQIPQWGALMTVYAYPVSGSPLLKIGTTDGGVEISIEELAITGFTPIVCNQYREVDEVIIFKISGGVVKLRIEFKTRIFLT
jgi:hypothetical protein